MYSTYVLKSEKDGRLYIGYTSNLKNRLQEHAQGLVKSTKHRRPLVLVYQEQFENKKDAEARERYFKGGGRARKLLGQLLGA